MGMEREGVTLSATPPGRIVLTITPVVLPPTMPKPRPVPSLTSSMVSMCCHCFTRARDSGRHREREREREGGERETVNEREREHIGPIHFKEFNKRLNKPGIGLYEDDNIYTGVSH